MKVTTEAKVGMITIVGIILLVYIIVHLGGFRLGVKGYPVQVAFAGVNGLKSGNLVRYAGVEVGRVSSVNVAPEGIMVEMVLQSGVRIPRSAKFRIGIDGLMGEKFIDITPTGKASSEEILQAGDLLQGEETQCMDKLLATANETLMEVKKLVQTINEFTGDQNVRMAFKDTILNAREISASLQAMTAALSRMAVNNEADVNTMVANLSAMSGSLKQVAGRVDTMLASVDNNRHTAADLKETIANIKATSSRVEKMAVALENVVTDQETARNLKETIRNAKNATEKADNILNKFGGVAVKPGFEALCGKDSSNFSVNADLRVTTSSQKFAILGINDIDEGNRLNLQLGKGDEKQGRRFGIVDSKPGVGLDTSWGDRWRFSLDAYDPNNFKLRLRSLYQLSPDTFLVVQANNLNRPSEWDTFLGIRTSF